MDFKKIFTSFFVTIIIIFLGIIILGNDKNNSPQSGSNQATGSAATQNNAPNVPIYFYSDVCPHCAETEKWMEENNIEQKIKLIKKEVHDNQQNAQELTKAAISCNIKTDAIGVPFLYAEKKCYLGSPNIEAYLAQKAGISPTEGVKK
jgi:glutaredoxin